MRCNAVGAQLRCCARQQPLVDQAGHSSCFAQQLIFVLLALHSGRLAWSLATRPHKSAKRPARQSVKRYRSVQFTASKRAFPPWRTVASNVLEHKKRLVRVSLDGVVVKEAAASKKMLHHLSRISNGT